MQYSKGWKYRLEEGLAYKLQTPLSVQKYSCPYWVITETCWLILMPGYMWDGATCFPDFDWILTPSAIHDALHQAIQLGVIPESENALIDQELALAIEGNPTTRWSKRQLLKMRSFYVRKATNTVHERKGNLILVHQHPRIVGELSLKDYQTEYGVCAIS